MSITRAFTTRRVKQSIQAAEAAESMPHRSNTTRAGAPGLSIRHKISAPIELVHTTNMLSYDAPDLFPKADSASSSSSTKSDDDTDSVPTSSSSPPTSPDSPFPSSIKRSASPEPNHLSCYFTAPGQAFSAPFPDAAPAPAIPKRAPSHTKKASYEALNRQRSMSRLSEQSSRTVSSTQSSISFSRSSSVSTATRSTSHSSVHSQHMPKLSHSSSFSALAPPSMPPTGPLPVPVVAPAAAPAPAPAVSAPPRSYVAAKRDTHESHNHHHPFGQELAQVSELAEEYGASERFRVIDEDEQALVARGLKKFSAEEYLSEIQGLFNTIFAEKRPVAALWI